MARGVPPVDHFPSTHRTWLETQIDAGREARAAGDSAAHREAIRALSRHVMERYREPLRAYILGSRWRSFGDADDLVAGFFARRLDSLDYLERWHAVGISLRRWLMNGILLELRTLARDARRLARREGGPQAPADAQQHETSHEPTAERAFDRAWARGILVEATAQAAAELAEEGRESSWRLFERHVLDGVEYAAAADELGVPRGEARAMSRMAQYRLRRAIAAVLRDDGVAAADLERTVEDVYAAALGD